MYQLNELHGERLLPDVVEALNDDSLDGISSPTPEGRAQADPLFLVLPSLLPLPSQRIPEDAQKKFRYLLEPARPCHRHAPSTS